MSNINCDFCCSCDSCKFCYNCDSCNLCYSCNFCYSCNDCDSCKHCKFCNDCKNLVHGFMCINLKFDKKDETKYWIFNKEVTKEEWDNRFNIGKEIEE